MTALTAVSALSAASPVEAALRAFDAEEAAGGGIQGAALPLAAEAGPGAAAAAALATATAPATEITAAASTTLSQLVADHPAAQALQRAPAAPPAPAPAGSAAAAAVGDAAAAAALTASTAAATPVRADAASLALAPTAVPASPAQLTPALVTPLFTLASDPARWRKLPKGDEPARRRALLGSVDDGASAGDADDTDDHPADAANDAPPLPEPAPQPQAADDADYSAWRQRLGAAMQREALRELDQRRRVLVVCPTVAADGAAVAWLLAAHPRGTAQRFRAHWWAAGAPGSVAVATAADASAPWPAWRLHREDSGARHSLRSRPAAPGLPACRVRLDVPPNPTPTWLPDPGCAQLEPADPQRFARALGTQWSLLLLAAPPAAAVS